MVDRVFFFVVNKDRVAYRIRGQCGRLLCALCALFARRLIAGPRRPRALFLQKSPLSALPFDLGFASREECAWGVCVLR